MREESFERVPEALGDRDESGVVGEESCPVPIGVDLDPDPQSGSGDDLGHLHRIHDHPEPDSPLDEGQRPWQLVGGEPDGVGEIGEPVVGEVLRLPQRRDGEGLGPDEPGHLGRLGGLEVRPEPDTESGHLLVHPSDVRPQPIEFEQQSRCVEFRERRHVSDATAVRCHRIRTLWYGARGVLLALHRGGIYS